jgi:hypothetical protein
MTPYYDQIAIDYNSKAGMHSDRFMIGISGGTVTWNGLLLVLELSSYTGYARGSGDWTERREIWALQPNGELAITIAISGSAVPAQTISALYRRL